MKYSSSICYFIIFSIPFLCNAFPLGSAKISSSVSQSSSVFSSRSSSSNPSSSSTPSSSKPPSSSTPSSSSSPSSSTPSSSTPSSSKPPSSSSSPSENVNFFTYDRTIPAYNTICGNILVTSPSPYDGSYSNGSVLGGVPVGTQFLCYAQPFYDYMYGQYLFRYWADEDTNPDKIFTVIEGYDLNIEAQFSKQTTVIFRTYDMLNNQYNNCGSFRFGGNGDFINGDETWAWVGDTYSLSAAPFGGYQFDSWGGNVMGGSPVYVSNSNPFIIEARFSWGG